MRIPVHIERRLSAAPESVLEALRHAGLWHAADIPETARAAGVRSLEVTTNGQRITWKLYLSRSRGRYAPPSPQLHLRVQSDGAGSRVTGECRRPRLIFIVPIIVTLLLLVGMWRHEGITMGTALVIAVLWIIPVAYYMSVGGDYESDAKFLLGRLDDVLQSSKPSHQR